MVPPSASPWHWTSRPTHAYRQHQSETASLRLLAIFEQVSHRASFLPEEKRSIHPRNRDRHELDRQKHTADDGFGCRRRKNKVHPQKLRRLIRWSLPRRKHEGKDQKNDHSIEYADIELPWSRTHRSKRRWTVSSAIKSSPALHAEPIDLRL